jgi:transcription initiation factor TFIIIB Brf1 subunit/transcription initiation factor TFIIB
MYRARDERDNAEWLSELEAAADHLDLDAEARSCAREVFLSAMPEQDRSKPAALAGALYVGALVAGDRRPQGTVADAVGVSRPAVQTRWKEMLEAAELDAPEW